jgi:hypothetical protein
MQSTRQGTSLSLETADYGFLEWIKTSGKQRRRTTKILSVKRVRAHQFSRQIRPTGNVLIVQLSHHFGWKMLVQNKKT